MLIKVNIYKIVKKSKYLKFVPFSFFCIYFSRWYNKFVPRDTEANKYNHLNLTYYSLTRRFAALVISGIQIKCSVKIFTMNEELSLYQYLQEYRYFNKKPICKQIFLISRSISELHTKFIYFAQIIVSLRMIEMEGMQCFYEW